MVKDHCLTSFLNDAMSIMGDYPLHGALASNTDVQGRGLVSGAKEASSHPDFPGCK